MTITSAVDASALIRSALIFLHLLAVAAAASGIAFGDYAIFREARIDRRLLAQSTRGVACALLVLWITGGGVIAIDLQPGPLAMAYSPKLLAKLSVVIALSANGWLMHRFVFAALGPGSAGAPRDARLASVLGAISTVSWAYALFLGVARAWTPLLGYAGFVGLYGLALALGIAVSLRLMTPVLAAKFTA